MMRLWHRFLAWIDRRELERVRRQRLRTVLRQHVELHRALRGQGGK